MNEDAKTAGPDRAGPWFTRSADVYDVIYAAVMDYDEEAATLVDVIERLAPSAQSVLEVGCGTGQFLDRFSRRYERVVGVDVSEDMLDVCHRNFPDLDARVGDMRDLDLGERFDAILCLFASVGYVRTRQALDRSVAAMAGHLNSGGVLVVDGWIRPENYVVGYRHAMTAHGRGVTVTRHSLAHEAPPGESLIDMAHLVSTPTGFEYYVERHPMGLFSDDVVVAAFRAAGVTDVEVLEWRDRGRYVGVAP